MGAPPAVGVGGSSTCVGAEWGNGEGGGRDDGDTGHSTAEHRERWGGGEGRGAAWGPSGVAHISAGSGTPRCFIEHPHPNLRTPFGAPRRPSGAAPSFWGGGRGAQRGADLTQRLTTFPPPLSLFLPPLHPSRSPKPINGGFGGFHRRPGSLRITEPRTAAGKRRGDKKKERKREKGEEKGKKTKPTKTQNTKTHQQNVTSRKIPQDSDPDPLLLKQPPGRGRPGGVPVQD